jgi:hypothetical protein
MSEDRIAKLERELAELKAQVKPPVEDKEPREPWPKYDPTESFRLPASAVRAMVDVVPDMRGLAQEQRNGRSEPGWLPASPAKGPEERRSGPVNPLPLESPSGIKWIDRAMDVQDQLDRAERMKGFGAAFGGGPKVMTKGN